MGALAAGSFVAVLASLTQEPGVPYAFPPPGATTGSANDNDPDLGPDASGAPRLPEPAPTQEIDQVSFQDSGPGPVAVSGLAPGGGTSDEATDGPTDGPGQGPGSEGPQPERPRVSELLAPAEQLVLRALGIATPELVPVADDVFETTGGLLDSVENALPVRLGGSKR